MGSAISAAFIPPDSLLGCSEVDEVVTCLPPELSHDWIFGFIQVLFLGACYGYVLYFSSNMLSEGSELLLLVPSLAGLVGSIVLPILGAVPDGAIMLFSGLGPDAQEQLSVGVGALAGSTIMLLTIPWGLAIFAGSVPIGRTGQALYGKKAIAAEKARHAIRRGSVTAGRPPRTPPPKGLWGFGVSPGGTIKTNAALMVGTSLLYLIIQGPAFQFAKEGSEVNEEVANDEHWPSLVGLLATTAGFFFYLWAMLKQSGNEVQQKLVDEAMIKQLESHASITLTGIIGPILAQSRTIYRKVSAEGLGRFKESLLGDNEAHRLKRILQVGRPPLSTPPWNATLHTATLHRPPARATRAPPVSPPAPAPPSRHTALTLTLSPPRRFPLTPPFPPPRAALLPQVRRERRR